MAPSATSTKKARARPPKSTTLAGKAKISMSGSDQPQAKDAKTRLIAEAKPVDSPSPSEVTSSSEEESNSEAESEEEEDDEMAVEQMSDVSSFSLTLLQPYSSRTEPFQITGYNMFIP